MSRQLSVHRLPFTVLYPLTVIRDQWQMVNGKCMVNGQWKMVNEVSEGGVW